MSDPIGTKCGVRGFDASKCKEADYPSCADVESKGATLRQLTVSGRGKVEAYEAASKRPAALPPFYLVRRLDSMFWLGYPGENGVCRVPHDRYPAITKSWHLYKLPSVVTPVASTPPVPAASPEMEAVKEAAAPVMEYLKPFERAYKECVSGNYDGALDELGTPQRTGLGLAGGLMLLGAALVGLKRRARKRAEVLERQQRERTATLESEAASSPPVSHIPDTTIDGTEKTVGLEQMAREGNAVIYSGRGTMPSVGNERFGRLSTVPDTEAEPSYIESLSRKAWLPAEDLPSVVEALQSLDADVGGMTVRQSYERGIGMQIPMRIWKMATLIALRYYRHAEADLGKTIGSIVAGAASRAGRGRPFGAVDMMIAAERLSGVAINQGEASEALIPYREWIVDDETREPYANRLMRATVDSDLDPFSREVMEELRKLPGSGVSREEAIHFLESMEGKKLIEEAKYRYQRLPDAEKNGISLARYIAVSAAVKKGVGDGSNTPVGQPRADRNSRELDPPGRARRKAIIPEGPIEVLRETVGRAKK